MTIDRRCGKIDIIYNLRLDVEETNMKHLICEVCESDNIIKQDGLFICQSCGAKYSIEEIKRWCQKVLLMLAEAL